MKFVRLTLVLLAFTACGDDPAEPPVPVATTIELTPAVVTLTALGASQPLTAAVKDQNGALMNALVTWTSSDSTRVRVSPAGVVTAVGVASNVTITATAGTARASATVSVVQSPARVDVIPPSVTLTAIGAMQQLTAIVRDANGQPIPGVAVQWSSSDSTRVRVSQTGLITALAAGTNIIVTATTGAIRGTAAVFVNVAATPSTIEISPPTLTLAAIGAAAQLSATVRDAAGNVILGAPVSWTSSDTTRVRVSPTGVVTAVANGTARITARSGSAMGTRDVTVAATAAVQLPVLGLGSVRDRYTSEVAVTGSAAYTGTWSTRGGAPGNAVKIWNVATSTPLLVDSLIIPGAGTTGDVQISDDGRLLVVANEYNPNGAVTLYDISAPLQPVQLSRFTSTEVARGVHTVKLSRIGGRHYAFLSINPAGGSAARLVIVDVTEPRNPSQVFQAVMGQPYVHDVFVRDGLLFTALWDGGMTIWDVGAGIAGGSPSNPVQLGNVRTVGGQVHNIHWFHDPRTGSRRYAFVGQETPLAGGFAGDIHVVDVSDLRAPREVAFFSVPGSGTHNFAVDEASGVLYAAFYNGGVRALDIRGDLGNCTAEQRAGDGRCNLALMGREIGRALTDRAVQVWGVALGGTALYASDMLNGLWKIDASALKR